MMTAELAHSLWFYEWESGALVWRDSPRIGKKAGMRAGTIGSHGYWIVTFEGKKYRASRIIWLMVNGRWPLPEIDHQNGNRADDRFNNLREATRTEQLGNTRVRVDNSLGVKGVSPSSHSPGKFCAFICRGGKRKNLGTFSTIMAARAAYDAAAVEWHGQFSRSA
jgi:HNH endonuclease